VGRIILFLPFLLLSVPSVICHEVFRASLGKVETAFQTSYLCAIPGTLPAVTSVRLQTGQIIVWLSKSSMQTPKPRATPA
jgi:hypothetical protein